jgi:hypothetical protein
MVNNTVPKWRLISKKVVQGPVDVTGRRRRMTSRLWDVPTGVPRRP